MYAEGINISRMLSMKRMGHRQAGFSIVEAVVVAAVIGIIGTGGWFVYQHNRTKVTNAAASSNQATDQQATTTPATTQNVVKIPELGIQLTVPDSIKDLTYQVSTVTLPTQQTATIVKFSTQALTAADPKCSASFGPLGSLEKVAGQYPTNDPNAAFHYGQLVKQFPTFFISGGSPNAGCSTNPTATTAMGEYKAAFISAQSSLQTAN